LRRACRVHDYPLRVLAVVSGLVAVALFVLPSLVRPLLPEERRGTNGMDGHIMQIDLCRERFDARHLSFVGYAYVVDAPPIDLEDVPGWARELQAWADYWRPQLEYEAQRQRWLAGESVDHNRR
ncbi:MAG TPA: hypothetical protein VK034_31995, partial [Enhygromyxa sp.]|nr:hypothetical protein [Enhygromyxa sp.]